MTILLILLNVVIFIYQLSLGEEIVEFIEKYAAVPADIVEALNSPLENSNVLTTLITAMFLHAGFFHLFGNMLFLWIFGDNIEDALGHIRFLIFYLLCGVFGTIVHIFFHIDSVAPLVGASGAIAGVLGAYFFLYPFARIQVLIPLFFLFPIIRVPALFFLGGWFIIQLISGWTSITHEVETSVAWWAHAGGFAAGILLVVFFVKRR